MFCFVFIHLFVCFFVSLFVSWTLNLYCCSLNFKKEKCFEMSHTQMKVILVCFLPFDSSLWTQHPSYWTLGCACFFSIFFLFFCQRSLLNQGSQKVMSWRFPNTIRSPGSWLDCKEAVRLGFHLSCVGGGYWQLFVSIINSESDYVLSNANLLCGLWHARLLCLCLHLLSPR